MTPAWVASVKPEGAPVEWRDSGGKARGLILRVETSGLKTWVLRFTFQGRGRRFKIGASPAVSLSAARTAALRMAGLAENGTDPQAERERLRVGQHVAAAVAAWLADTKHGPAALWKGGITGGSSRSFLPHIRRFVRDLGPKKLAELTHADIERFVSHPVALATRNHALTALRAFYWWAGRKSLVDADPTLKMEKEKGEAERKRVLTDDELRGLILGFDPTRYGRAVRLLALTGLRRDEVLAAKWTWFDTETATLTIPPEAEKEGVERAKREEVRLVALSPQAVAVLTAQRAALFAQGIFDRDGFIFATTSSDSRPHPDALKPILYALRGRRPNGTAASVDKRAKVRVAALPLDVTIHDVRRSLASRLRKAPFKVHPWVIDHEILGHLRSKNERTYQVGMPIDDARAALTMWGAELDRIIGEAPAARAEAK